MTPLTSYGELAKVLEKPDTEEAVEKITSEIGGLLNDLFGGGDDDDDEEKKKKKGRA